MWRSQYRNFGTHATLVGNFVTDVDGNDRGGVRWYELRRSGGAWSLYQEGTYAPDTTHRWMGSIAMDGGGNIALGYSASSTGVFPSIRYTGRLAGDTLGTMPQVETTIVAGSGSNNSNRWGDYSAMNVDPADDCTFWYTNEYATANGTWNTRVASFRFDSCAGGPTLPSLSVNDVQVTEGNTGTSNATFTVTQSETSAQTVSVDYATADGTAQAASGADVFTNAATITLPASGTEGNAGPYPSTITVPARAALTKVAVSLTLSHTYPADIDILLVGPTGQSVVLMSDVGGGTDAVNVAMTFDDTGSTVPGTLTSGTFRPTNNGAGDSFPSPAPQGTPGSTLSVFNGTDPTGTWSLYALDDAAADSGSVSGWSLWVEPTTGGGDYAAATGTVSLPPVTKVTVTLSLSHTYPADVDILLVGPTGQSVVLMSDVGGGTDAVNVALTFDDLGPGLSTPLSSGTFRPTNTGGGDPFPSPAPQTTPAATLAAFNGTNPTGTWSLYVEDDASEDSGHILGGWSLGLEPSVAAAGTLSFSPGTTTQTIAVSVAGDTTVEPNETFVVNLKGPVNATLADTQGTAVIVNDDGGAVFTDPNLAVGDPIKAVHIAELRTRIDALRTLHGLQKHTFSDPVLTPGVTLVRAAHLLELRTALNQAYTAAAQTPPSYTDSAITVGSTLIRVVHIKELRTAVVALESL